MTEKIFDVAIVGGGLVGSSLALALRDSNLSVALMEARAPQQKWDADSWDNRVYAVSPGSVDFLSDLGVWASLPTERIAAIEAMDVYGDDARSHIEFQAYEAGLGQLAHIVESRALQSALWQLLQADAGPQLFCPAQVAALQRDNDAIRLHLADGEIVATRLLVAADGPHSWVRQQAGIASRDKDYQQLGVVANFATSLPHQGVAYQWFGAQGVIAYLPLPGKRMSIVWSLQEDAAQTLLQLPADEICARVAAAGHHRLGDLSLLTPPAAFPLHLVAPSQISQARLVLIGDAAHQVHPLAGQGVNLGFADARVLSQVLKARGPRDCGDYLLLRRFERARREAILAMQSVTDGLHDLFSPQHASLAWLRNTGLAASNRLAWVKRQLMKQALGRV